jgi:hypothetical protein
LNKIIDSDLKHHSSNLSYFYFAKEHVKTNKQFANSDNAVAMGEKPGHPVCRNRLSVIMPSDGYDGATWDYGGSLTAGCKRGG